MCSAPGDGGCVVEAGGDSHVIIVDSIVIQIHLHMNFQMIHLTLYNIR